MRLIYLTSLILCVAPAFSQSGFMMDLSKAPLNPELFGEGFVSTRMNERDFAISPDGKEVYFTITTPRSTLQTIVSCTRQKDRTWSPPKVVSFSGKFSDLEPSFSADGNTLYFASNRPIEGSDRKDFDIWKVTRQRDGWGTPQNLGQPINSKGDEFYPSVAKNGNLYFTATYSHGVGKEDIFVSKWDDEAYLSPVALDTTINSALYEFNAFVSPDEEYIIYSSFGRKGEIGRGDLYISLKQNGKWKPSIHLSEINSPFLDYCPYVSPDGKVLYFTSERHNLPAQLDKQGDYAKLKEIHDNALNGGGNIYWMDFESLLNRLHKDHESK